MVDGGQVDLEVTRVEDDALRGVHGNRVRVRHRVGDRDELDVERTDRDGLAVAGGDHVGLLRQAGFVDAVAGEPEREPRSVDRQRLVTQVADAVAVAQQVLDRTHVVFVAVREHERRDAGGVLAQIREVGQDQIDPVHVRIGEHQPAVDQDDRTIGIVGGAVLDRHAVATDLAEAAEEDDPNGRPGRRIRRTAGRALRPRAPVLPVWCQPRAATKRS